MAGSRTTARGLQPIPSVTEKCYPVALFVKAITGSSVALAVFQLALGSIGGRSATVVTQKL